MPQEHLARLEALRASLPEQVKAHLVSNPSHIFYLSGFTGSAGMLLVSRAEALLFSDFRYRLQAAEQAPDYEFVEIAKGLVKSAGQVAQSRGLRRLAVDPVHLTCQAQAQFAEGAGEAEVLPCEGLVEALRAIKSPAEIDRIRAAAALADRALAHMVSLLRPGVTERELALKGEFLMRREGAQSVSFDMIVASGPHGALPHAETTDRPLQPGDLVVVDLGARVQGYCSDMTRTFGLGPTSREAKAIYDLVYRAQRAALAQVRAGAVCGDLDAIARTLITEAGHGDDFGHGLGHGVGIDVHEAPRLGREVETVLEVGHVVTVEPGVYLAGIGGVRLEDLVAVGAESIEVLTQYPMASELPVLC
jgi:Xaa-Pro aminopeptidase